MEKEKAKPKHFKFILVLCSSVFAAVLIAFLIRGVINKALYQERKTSLNNLMQTASRSINNNVEAQWEIARVYQNDIKSHLAASKNVEQYLSYLNTQIANKGDYYFLVDSTGKYYCTDGVCGKIRHLKYFIDSTADEVEFLDTLPHFNDGVTYLILRSRLETPVVLDSVNGKVEIKYCALIHNVSGLVDYIGDLFNGYNNTIVYDTDTGLFLYKYFGIRLLLEGYNIYDKFKRVDLAYGDKAEDLINQIKNRQQSISLMQLESEQFYLCSIPLAVSNWSLMLVVDGRYFNETSGAAFTKVAVSIAIILGIAALLCVALFGFLAKLKTNKKLLENEQQVNEALNEAYQIKSNFLSYMSHDIRTPINGMIGMAKIGTDNSENKEKVEECFKKIDLSSKHLLAIVNDVLDMSAIESGKIVIQNEKMDITQTLSSCLDIIKGTLNNRTLHIIEDYDCPDTLVLGDEFHLKQIVINILSNAVKFTEDGGTIGISCVQLDQKDNKTDYRITISDTGCGMTEEFKNHIFEAFRTASPDGKAKYKGSGLGMAISKEYVNLMNGTIKVDSKLGQGSVFTIDMPFEKVTDSQSQIDLSNFNVLLADDNDINLEIAKEMLKDKVKDIQIAHNGQEALEKFTASAPNQFQIVLMDIQMPVMDGYGAAKAIRNTQRPDNNVLIIALTANSYKDDIDLIFDSGMNGYLNKPFTVEQLLEKLKYLLKKEN